MIRCAPSTLFQSTLPLRGATGAVNVALPVAGISIHAPLAGSDSPVTPAAAYMVISIHAPLAGSDHQRRRAGTEIHHFNPRSPCGERRMKNSDCVSFRVFQSTLPLRGATILITAARFTSTDFNPRSPCGERPVPAFRVVHMGNISIHAPLAGSDLTSLFPTKFLHFISIHAPLAGSDG